MGVVGEKLDVDFIISTGDNFYDDGIANTSDPLFMESFTNIYTADSLQNPWYIGNACKLSSIDTFECTETHVTTCIFDYHQMHACVTYVRTDVLACSAWQP
jgi:hypothetical protein